MKRIYTISGLLLLFTFFTTAAFAQNITVKGKVTDGANGEALIGVTVAVKGTTNGTQTDANGAYSLSAPSNATLQVSYIGYTTQDIAVGGRAAIDVKLQGTNNQLQQVVVIGYGTQRKVDNTGSVASVKAADINNQASTNPVAALQGKVSGVTVTNNGTPGSAPQITIRGLGTVYGNVSPLYVVDGVWYSDISFLNNNDIENITILKDASSTAIYGVRAANGVVLITTKHGTKDSTPTINYNGYVGFQAITNQVKMANASEYATAINELVDYGNQLNTDPSVPPKGPTFADPASLGNGTDWYKQILRKAFVTSHQVSVTGGTKAITYNYSFGYLDQDGLVKNNNYKRYTLHLANEFNVFSFLKVGYNANGVLSKSKDAPATILNQIFSASPALPAFNADGTYGNPALFGASSGNNYNPQATLDFYNQVTKNDRATGDVHAEVSILKNLKFRTSLGGDFGTQEVRNFTPLYNATPAQNTNTSNLDINQTKTKNWIWENTLTYDYQVKDHRLTALLGYSAQNNRITQIDARADGVPYNGSGDLYSSFPADATVSRIKTAGDQIHTRTLSQFARINYSFQNKYLINASLRRDGSSQFFPNPYGWFPSVGAGWVITNESFMKDQHIFDVLKLRGSWGKVGNSVVPINPSVQTVANDPYLTAIFGNAQIANPGASINTFVPPLIRWEKGVSSDFGLEMAFLNNRLSFEADYYNRETQDAIFAIPVLGSLGSASGNLIGNQANIRNRGIELMLSWKDSPNESFSYSLSGNVGFNNNKVLSVISGNTPIYDGGSGISNGALATRTIVGDPIGTFYGYKVAGIFQTTQEIAASKQPTAIPGDFIYEDVNKDGVLDTRDRTQLGSPNPKISYGFNSTFNYKSFDLTLDFQGLADVSVYNANIAYRFGNENFTQDFYSNRWHGPGTSTTYPSTNVGSTANSAPNSFYVESGAYFRVRNAQLGYTLPGNTLKKLGVQKIRFYANAQNAINIFGYKGFTPEIGGTVGNMGIDASVYPLFATYNFGVNVTF
jgi:TonB-linked SusC/RagA family outer membrane protein